MRSIVYHQFRKELYIIKAVRFVYHQAAGGYTLTRDEIQPEGLMICTALRAVMICQACGLDIKIPKAFAFGIFWRRVDKKDATLKIISFDFFDIHQSLLCECF